MTETKTATPGDCGRPGLRASRTTTRSFSWQRFVRGSSERRRAAALARLGFRHSCPCAGEIREGERGDKGGGRSSGGARRAGGPPPSRVDTAAWRGRATACDRGRYRGRRRRPDEIASRPLAILFSFYFGPFLFSFSVSIFLFQLLLQIELAMDPENYKFCMVLFLE